MKILVCGDIHCKPDIIRAAIEAKKWDKFIFLGDACDNWSATQEDNLRTLSTVIELKQTYEDNFIWLLGNHDWGYYDDSIKMTGHIHAGSAQIRKILEDAFDLWELLYCTNGYVFSHAGVSLPWLRDSSGYKYIDIKRCRGLNNPMNQVGPACGGLSDTPSPLWARPSEVVPIPFENIQIVGHTPVEKICRAGEDLIVCDTFSQDSKKNFIGDRSLLYIDGDEMYAIDYLTGRKLYDV